MPVSNNSRLASVVVASILILFAFLAILNANSLAWPLASQVGNNGNKQNPSTPPGQLVISANLIQPTPRFTTGIGTILNSQKQPLPGVNATIFALNQLISLASMETDSFGYSTLNLSQGLYNVHLNTHYSNLTVQVSIISKEITHLSLNVNETQHLASFFDLMDASFIGQVLPSESVYLEINGSEQQINASQFIDLQIYNFPEISNGGNFTIFSISFSQIEQVRVTIVSMTESSANNSFWVELRPNSPVNTTNVQYVGLDDFGTTYNVTISSSGVATPIA